ncbi:hypothetical protein SADUNF_Sadunf06G0030500 [Salix dunnii]|uniref:Peptide chain release factor domain-containing protein n=1 Tax=Salix dunnii TaxID=1413687 RepID=A0A835K718_9ROSI|nr:hypothetical protein SADUNF_Sadunf06G0030500 [Salix dunnii]
MAAEPVFVSRATTIPSKFQSFTRNINDKSQAKLLLCSRVRAYQKHSMDDKNNVYKQLGLFSLKKNIEDTVLRAEMLAPTALEHEEARRIKQEEMIHECNLWEDPAKSNEILIKLAGSAKAIDALKDLKYKAEEAKLISQLVEMEAINYRLFKQAYTSSLDVRKLLDQYEMSRLLKGPYDKQGACVVIKAGSKGFNHEIWTEELLNMYVKWAEKLGYEGRLVEKHPSMHGGIESATIEFEFECAYGYLFGERGIHHKINSQNGSVHHEVTLACVDVVPLFLGTGFDFQIDDEELIVSCSPSLLRNGKSRTELTVCLQHIPTGISVQSSGERSHFANKMKAHNRLKAKLLVIAEEQKVCDVSSIRRENIVDVWQKETRRYVSQPYKLVQDGLVFLLACYDSGRLMFPALIHTSTHLKGGIFGAPRLHRRESQFSIITPWKFSFQPAYVDLYSLSRYKKILSQDKGFRYRKMASQNMEKLESDVAIIDYSKDVPLSTSYEVAMKALLPLLDRKNVEIEKGLVILDLEEHMAGLKIIHVAGTKGKGSTCTFCEAILRESGYRTGLFTSPHLIDVRERFRINGVDISEDKFLLYFWNCWNRLKIKMMHRAHPSIKGCLLLIIHHGCCVPLIRAIISNDVKMICSFEMLSLMSDVEDNQTHGFGVKVIYRSKELEEQQDKSWIWNETWLSSFFYKPYNYELFVKQSLNMEMAFVMAREAGMEWIIHLNTDGLIHPAGAPEYFLRQLLSDVPGNVDMVIFLNYESSVERDDIKEPFSAGKDHVSMFKKNHDHLPKDIYFGNYKEAIRGNPNFFLTYGNVKSAAHIQDHLRPNGAHRWHNYMKILKHGHSSQQFDMHAIVFFLKSFSVNFASEVKLEEAAVLHYTYPKFSDLTTRFDLCGCKPTLEDVKRCSMLEFNRAAFISVSTVTEEEVLHWSQERILWTDEALKLLRKGILTRIYAPMVVVHGLRESGVFSSVIASTQNFLSSVKNSNSSMTAGVFLQERLVMVENPRQLQEGSCGNASIFSAIPPVSSWPGRYSHRDVITLHPQ